MRGKLPLADLRVLDFAGSRRAHSHHLPDDYGAEMIKIGPPGSGALTVSSVRASASGRFPPTAQAGDRARSRAHRELGVSQYASDEIEQPRKVRASR